MKKKFIIEILLNTLAMEVDKNIPGEDRTRDPSEVRRAVLHGHLLSV